MACGNAWQPNQEHECWLENYLARLPDKHLRPITQVTPELIEGLHAFWLAGLEADLDWRREVLSEEECRELEQNIAEIRGAIA